jgi:glycosidase
MSTITHLRNLQEAIRTKKGPASGKYYIPALWFFDQSSTHNDTKINVDPVNYYSETIRYILNQKAVKITHGAGGSWTNRAVIYNMFVRSSTAFDHNQNGKLDLPHNRDGWRETGTFLKAIALLPYIRSLGVNTIHLLPITSIGSDGNKGSLGSPYAIKNPYELDPNLSEPNVGVGVEEEFKAFVEGAHHLGMRVVVEFVFRTSAKDGDWVKEHPEWVYWIRNAVQDRSPGSHDESKYGSPVFTHDELEKIKASAKLHDLNNLIPPHDVYRKMFTQPPTSETIKKRNGRYIGRLQDGTEVRIPGAFADWPPDDSQPPWGDVTYLKMYDHPDFNYIAYNTIRMYDSRLAESKYVNKPLWKAIAGIIPHYQKSFHINGVMIDMGHALPMELKHEMVRHAREIDPDFAFWDENFSVLKQSVEEGYNAVIGYQWSDQHHPHKFKAMLQRFGSEGFPISFFATAESHNTPRAAARKGGVRYSKYAWAMSNFLPAIPFIHSGFEVGEKLPVNTGLDFTADDLKKYPSESLPLFSEGAYDWENPESFIDWIRKVANVRRRFEPLVIDSNPPTFQVLNAGNEHLLAFRRHNDKEKLSLLIVANSDMEKEHRFSCPVSETSQNLTDLLSDDVFIVHNSHISGALSPGEVKVFVE